MHPNQELPYGLGKTTNVQMPFKFNGESSSSKNSDDEDDDNSEKDKDDVVITLNGCGITTKWRPPAGLLKCPVLNCQQSFKARSNLVSHYKENHAKGSILCKICQKV